MAENLPKFEVFSSKMINDVFDYVLSQSRLQRKGLPSYPDLIASNQTFNYTPRLSAAQQKDYETLRSNLDDLLAAYLREHPKKKPVSKAASPSPFCNPNATKEDYEAFMADLERKLKNSSERSAGLPKGRSKLVEYLRTYVLNANLVASRKSKPTFDCDFG